MPVLARLIAPCLMALALLAPLLAAPLQVVTPYPLLASAARSIGGDAVAVTLITSRDVHSFSPTPQQLAVMAQADVILLLGKEMEHNWLADLKDSLTDPGRIFPVGDAVSDLAAGGDHSTCTEHDHHRTDPHWWQSIECWEEASSWIAEDFATRLPEQETELFSRADAFAATMQSLRDEFTPRFQQIPAPTRVVPVPHAAFGYLCAEFGLHQVPLQGVNSEGELPARHLETCVKLLRERQATALFTERGASTRGIEQLAAATGIPVRGELLADGDEAPELSVAEFLRHNLETIAKGLSPSTNQDSKFAN